jgi:hypothetical protein
MLARHLQPFGQFIAGTRLAMYPGQKNMFQRLFLAGLGFLQITHALYSLTGSMHTRDDYVFFDIVIRPWHYVFFRIPNFTPFPGSSYAASQR